VEFVEENFVAARKGIKRKDTGFEFERAVAAHFEATQKAGAWIEKVKGLRAAGVTAAAGAAERKVNGQSRPRHRRRS
jgi:hypothetical protein